MHVLCSLFHLDGEEEGLDLHSKGSSGATVWLHIGEQGAVGGPLGRRFSIDIKKRGRKEGKDRKKNVKRNRKEKERRKRRSEWGGVRMRKEGYLVGNHQPKARHVNIFLKL